MGINNSKRRSVWGIIALVIAAAVTGKILWSIDDWGRDFSSNHARLDDQAVDPRLRPVQVPISITAVREQMLAWVQTQPRWEVVEVDQTDGEVILHLIRTTPLLRFVDDIHVTLRPADLSQPDAATQINAESQSRIGKGDLGQNPRNLIELSASWRRD
jgi:uncharacterized protein (DUF1499 family)